jgi:cysteinyl-tRNA synthetase
MSFSNKCGREAMQNPEWSPRRLRLSFLLGSWADSAEITEGLISEVSSLESKFDNFCEYLLKAGSRCKTS